MVTLIVLTILSIMYMGCKERYIDYIKINTHENSPLKIIKCMCPKKIITNEDLEKTMNISKFFGPGTIALFTAIIIWNFRYFEK